MAATSELVANLYRLIGEIMVGEAVVADPKLKFPLLWDKRLGHMGEHGLHVLFKQILLSHLMSVSLKFCEDCFFEKQHRVSFSLYTHISLNGIELIQVDTCEEPIISLGGAYSVSFVDNYSRKVWLYMFKRESNLLEKLKVFKTLVEIRKGQELGSSN